MTVGASPVMGNGAMGVGKVRVMAKRQEIDDKKMDIDDEDGDKEMRNGTIPSPALSDSIPVPASTEQEFPAALKLSMQLTFLMLSHTLRKFKHKSSPLAHTTVNPYITVVLTFLATVSKDRAALSIMERFIPWSDLATFFNVTPRKTFLQELQSEREGAPLLTSGCAPLPEDWCLRGLAWGGKKVYERGFWTKDVNVGDDDRNVEVEVLDRAEDGNELVVDGIIEDDDGMAKPAADLQKAEVRKRWVRVARAGLKIAKYVDGFVFAPARKDDIKEPWKIDGVLAEKVSSWREEERRQRAEEEERRLRRRTWDDDSMDVDEEDVDMGDELSDYSEDGDDSEEVKALKARRRYLENLLQFSPHGAPLSPSRPRPRGQTPRKSAPPSQVTKIVPGYTVLVFDTNILLSSLSSFSALVESHQWTVLVPLPVIMELEGLSANKSELGVAASNAMSYIASHIRSHSISLKVQTSKGNYLTSLNVRTEQVDFSEDEDSWTRNMDDLILRAAIWQNEHWVDRSSRLKSDEAVRDTTTAVKVLFLSFDRMLRLKARSRQLGAATEQELARLLATSGP